MALLLIYSKLYVTSFSSLMGKGKEEWGKCFPSFSRWRYLAKEQEVDVLLLDVEQYLRYRVPLCGFHSFSFSVKPSLHREIPKLSSCPGLGEKRTCFLRQEDMLEFVQIPGPWAHSAVCWYLNNRLCRGRCPRWRCLPVCTPPRYQCDATECRVGKTFIESTFIIR